MGLPVSRYRAAGGDGRGFRNGVVGARGGQRKQEFVEEALREEGWRSSPVLSRGFGNCGTWACLRQW